MTNKPHQTIQDGFLKATLWRDDEPRIKGELGVRYSVTLSRLYRDKEGNYQDGTRFSGEELLRLAHLLGKAYDAQNEAELTDWKAKRLG